jgi:hypothetical protein
MDNNDLVNYDPSRLSASGEPQSQQDKAKRPALQQAASASGEPQSQQDKAKRPALQQASSASGEPQSQQDKAKRLAMQQASKAASAAVQQSQRLDQPVVQQSQQDRKKRQEQQASKAASAAVQQQPPPATSDDLSSAIVKDITQPCNNVKVTINGGSTYDIDVCEDDRSGDSSQYTAITYNGTGTEISKTYYTKINTSSEFPITQGGKPRKTTKKPSPPKKR